MDVVAGGFMVIFCSWCAFRGRDMHAVAAFPLREDRSTSWNNDMGNIIGGGLWWCGGGLRIGLRQRWCGRWFANDV